MRTFLGGLIKQPRKSTISMAVWTKRPRKWELFLAFRWNSQGKAQFPWRFDEKAKEMRTFLGVICKPPRQLQIFLAAYKICHEIIFSWLLTSTAKVTLYSLAVQSWPPRKSLAAKVIRFWCSVVLLCRINFKIWKCTLVLIDWCGTSWSSKSCDAMRGNKASHFSRGAGNPWNAWSRENDKFKTW